MAQRCGAAQFGDGGRVVRCAQQQPIAVNPGIDGADLADLEAHAATRVLAGACAHFHTTQRSAARLPAPARSPVRLCRLGEKHADELTHATDCNSHCIFLEVSPLSAGATLHWSKHAAAPFTPLAAKDKGQRPAQLELSHQSALSTSPCRCWDQCACRPPSPSSGRCRSVGGRAGCAAQAWRWQVRGQAQSVRPGGACDKGAVDRGTSRWLAPVDGVVHPPAALLHAHATPLRLGEKPPLGCILGDVFGQDDVAVRGGACEFARSLSSECASNARARVGQRGGASPVLKLIVEILLRVLDLLGCHDAAGEGRARQSDTGDGSARVTCQCS